MFPGVSFSGRSLSFELLPTWALDKASLSTPLAALSPPWPASFFGFVWRLPVLLCTHCLVFAPPQIRFFELPPCSPFLLDLPQRRVFPTTPISLLPSFPCFFFETCLGYSIVPFVRSRRFCAFCRRGAVVSLLLSSSETGGPLFFVPRSPYASAFWCLVWASRETLTFFLFLTRSPPPFLMRM